MNKEKALPLILAVLVPIVLFIWAKNLGLFRSRPKAVAAADAVVAAGLFEGALPDTQRGARRSEYQAWGRSPFAVTEQAEAFGTFNLEGIIMDPLSPYAIIDGEIKKEGDEIKGVMVAAIYKTKVILKKGKREIVLELFK